MLTKPIKTEPEPNSEFKSGNARINRPNDPIDKHYINIKRNIIEIEESKLEICARDYEEGVKAAQTWHTPFGIFITIILTMVTATFNSTTGSNIAWLALGASGFWLLGAIKSSWSARKKVKDVKSFVDSCKNFDYIDEKMPE